MNDLQEFVKIFKVELLDSDLNSSSKFKNHKNWSSLTSLIIITEIEGKFGVFVGIESLREAETIEELFNSTIAVEPK